MECTDVPSSENTCMDKGVSASHHEFIFLYSISQLSGSPHSLRMRDGFVKPVLDRSRIWELSTALSQ